MFGDSIEILSKVKGNGYNIETSYDITNNTYRTFKVINGVIDIIGYVDGQGIWFSSN